MTNSKTAEQVARAIFNAGLLNTHAGSESQDLAAVAFFIKTAIDARVEETQRSLMTATSHLQNFVNARRNNNLVNDAAWIAAIDFLKEGKQQ